MISAELEGVPHRLVLGSKHIKVIVHGKFIGVYPYNGRGESNVRSDLNIRAAIRRRVQEMTKCNE